MNTIGMTQTARICADGQIHGGLASSAQSDVAQFDQVLLTATA